MAINLATKYEKNLLQAYNQASLIAGKVNTDYDFIGVNSIHVYSVVTQALNDYNRTAAGNRYGTPAELQDTQQEMALTTDKSFAITIDKGNNEDQMMAKKTGSVVKAEIGEQVTPFFDKLALTAWATHAGTTETLAEAPTSGTVVDMFISARKDFVNAHFPMSSGAYAYVPSSVYSLLLKNPDFISVEKLGEKILTNGLVGKCMNWLIIEAPDDYFAAGTYALFTHKKSVLAPTKLSELKTHNDAPGISGVLIEGRYRGDAFVLDTLNKGVIVAKKA